MNIFFIHVNGIVPTAGGISRTTANLGTLLRKHGHGVWFVGAVNKHIDAEYDTQQLFLPSSNTFSEENQKFLKENVISKKIDVIVNQSPFTEAIVLLLYQCKKMTGVKIVSCYHNSILTPVIRYAYCHEFQLRQRHLTFLFHFLRWKPIANLLVQIYIAKWRKIFLQTIKNSDAVVLLCDGQVDELLRMLGCQNEPKAHVIPNCIQTTNNVCDVKEKVVLWVGTFDYAVKRPDLMLKIWDKVATANTDWKLYMLGDGPSLDTIKQSAIIKGVQNVVFTGRVDPTKYYEKSQIQCMTSVHEAFPMVPLEAMSHCMPVIAFSSFTSAKMIIQDKRNGSLITPFDVEAYANTLSKLICSEEMRKSMGLCAQHSILQFSEESVYEKWVTLFSHLSCV